MFSQERIRTYMNRVKEITDRTKAARLDRKAAARFVRSALYDKEEGGLKKERAPKKPADTPGRATLSKQPKLS